MSEWCQVFFLEDVTMHSALKLRAPCAGNGVLELLLFTPLFLFFILVVIDAGLLFADRAGLTAALRSGLNSEGIFSREYPLTSLDPLTSELVIDSSHLQPFLQSVAQQIAKTVSRSQGSPFSESPASYRVTVAAYQAQIDRSTGQLSPSPSMLASSEYGHFDLRQVDPSFPTRTPDEFVESELAQTTGQVPSPYAVAAPLLDVRASDSPHYLENTLLLYAEVASATRGLNTWLTRDLLGRRYLFQGMELRPIRTQVR